MSVLQMPPRSDWTTRKQDLLFQALYIAAQDLYRAHCLNPNADLTDIHPVVARKYHEAIAEAFQRVTGKP